MTEDSHDGAEAAECADEAPDAYYPGARWRERCSAVAEPATEGRWEAGEIALDEAFQRDEGVGGWHGECLCERG